MLLPAHRDCGHVLEAAGRARRLLQRDPPNLRIDLGAGRMRRPTFPDQCSRLRIADDDLARLGRRVDTCHEGHAASSSLSASGVGRSLGIRLRIPSQLVDVLRRVTKPFGELGPGKATLVQEVRNRIAGRRDPVRLEGVGVSHGSPR